MLSYMKKKKLAKNIIAIKIRKKVHMLFWGNYLSFLKWQGKEFADYGVYDEWMDASAIDWLASQREWKILIKRFQEEKQTKVFFVLDNSKTIFSWFYRKKIDVLYEIFSILAWSAYHHQDSIGGIIFNEYSYSFFPPQKWEIVYQKMLKTLEKKLHPHILREDRDILSLLHTLPFKSACIFICSDKIHGWNTPYLKMLALKHSVFFIHIIDHFEQTLWNNEYGIGMIGGNPWFFSYFHKKKKEEFTKYTQSNTMEWYRFLQKNNIGVIPLDTRKHILESIALFFQK